MLTVLDRETEQKQQTGHSECAHAIKTDGTESAAAKVFRASIEGTPVTALCGHVFVPQKDPKRLPVCQKCKDILDMEAMFGENHRWKEEGN